MGWLAPFLAWPSIWFNSSFLLYFSILFIVGLHWNDHAFEPDPQVKEAIRRLNLKDPYQYDQRIIRLHRGTLLTMNNERLPKEQWTKWDEETYYLEPYLEEIENEKHERVESSGIKPGFQLKTLGH